MLCLSWLTLLGAHGGARPNESKVGEQKARCWSIASDHEARLAHGWVSFDTADGAIAVREHVGGGTSSAAIDEPLELSLGTRTEGSKLCIEIVTRWRDRSRSMKSKTSIPKRGVMRPVELEAFSGLTTEYQVLWRLDFVEAGTPVKGVAYVARLSLIAEQYDGFGKHEIPKVKAALRRIEGQAANK